MGAGEKPDSADQTGDGYQSEQDATSEDREVGVGTGWIWQRGRTPDQRRTAVNELIAWLHTGQVSGDREPTEE